MIKHIVVWKLKDQAHGNDKATNARLIKEMLENLRGKIAGMPRLDVGVDFSATEASSDLALYSEFENQAALDAYQVHPAHVAAKAFIGGATSERRLVDYNT